MTRKALKTANFLRSLNRIQKGSPSDAVAKVAKACVTPVALFGAEAWWPGEERQSIRDPNRHVGTGTANLVENLDRVFRTAARAVLPAWKTTSVPVLHRESGIPPGISSPGTTKSADLSPRTAAIAGRVPRPSLFAKIIGSVRLGPELRGQPKAKAAERHLELLDSLPRTTLIAYSDGSQNKEGDTGWGAVTYHDCVATTDRGMLMNSEVYDAEAVGALKALELSRRLVTTTLKGKVSEIMLFLDNSAVVDGILGKTPDSSQGTYMKLRNIARELLPAIKIKVSWVPGHKNVLGNERADQLAKEGSELPAYPQPWSTVTHVKRWTRKKIKELWERAWDNMEQGPTGVTCSLRRHTHQNSNSREPSCTASWRKGQGTGTSRSTMKDSDTRPALDANVANPEDKDVSWIAEWLDPFFPRSARRSSASAQPT
ncbi:reverse transcriptase [Trichoderma arundinaceum]|uniref:Reverse transcriptase n=1 Tax=Trichoderma arundinaceum TaxID=490622 RepID=A0A395NR92_TRIAR|nr:reverse transcriptase [Trichoderma arundinaceum]